MLKQIIFVSIIVNMISCHFSNIDCETGPPSLSVLLLTSDGSDPIALQSVVLEDIQFKNLSNSTPAFSTYFSGIVGFSLSRISASYELSIKNIPIDTFDIKIAESKGECCTTFTINRLNNDGSPITFIPFITVNI